MMLPSLKNVLKEVLPGFATYYDATGFTIDEIIQKWVNENAKVKEKIYQHPIEDLWKYREYTWTRRTSRAGVAVVNDVMVDLWGPLKWDAIREDLKEHGWREGSWGMVIVGKNGKAKLGEGNHRLAIARELGFKTMPVMFANYESVSKSATPLHDADVPDNLDLDDIKRAIEKMPKPEKYQSIRLSELEKVLGIEKPKTKSPEVGPSRATTKIMTVDDILDLIKTIDG